MAKELITRIWCDRCEHDEGRVEATSFIVSVGGKPSEIDLCETCAKELIEPLRELIAAQGQPLAAKSKSSGLVCSECGKTYGSVKGYRTHRENVHSIIEQPPSGDITCAECGRAFRGQQGLASHMTKIHGAPARK